MSMHDYEERPYGDDVTEDVEELRRLSTVVAEAREALEVVKDNLKHRLTEVANRLTATEEARNVEYDYSHPDMSYADVLAHTALMDPSESNVEALADEMVSQVAEWRSIQHHFGICEDARAGWNPFWRLESIASWGQVNIFFNNGASACITCGSTTAHPRTIVPHHLLVDPAAFAATNVQPMCDTCAERWVAMPTTAHALAASLLIRGLPAGLESANLTPCIGLGTADMYTRDCGVCRVCGYADADPKAFHRGHIVSKHDGRDRRDGLAWGLPFTLTESALNYVLLCAPCNMAIGPASPSLRVGLRFLLKPWTDDPSGARLVEARRTAARLRGEALRAERLRRALGT